MLGRSLLTARVLVPLFFFASPIFGEVSFVVDSGVQTIFKDNVTPIVISIEWPADKTIFNPGDSITWEVMDNDQVIASDMIIGDALPTEIVTDITMKNRGRRTIAIDVHLNGQRLSTSSEFQVYASIVAIFPLIFVIVTAALTQMVELSLTFGIFVGAGIYTGSMTKGFLRTLEVYFVDSLGNGGHAFVYLFTFFLAGLIAIIERSGGLAGFAQTVSRFAKSSFSGQLACYFSGVLIFFDDYANSLVVGTTMRPTLDALMVSREKLAFIVDATAAPIASLVPLSSWIGYEISLINDEIEKIIAQNGENLTISTSGFTVFLESVKYRYYSIFMLIFVFLNVVLKREFGSMLIAERKVVVYGRTDGGEGGSEGSKKIKSDSSPKSDTPAKLWNFILPVLLLIFFIFYLLVLSGEDGSDQSFMDKIEGSDSYVALLDGTMATALITVLFYLVQFKKDGNIVLPELRSFLTLCGKRTNIDDDDDIGDESVKGSDDVPVPIVTVREAVDAFLSGCAKVFPALIVLTLAWATGAVMTDVGADRLFASWIGDGLSPKSLPTISYIVSSLIALCTGTSWGTMGIMFPIMLVPTYNSSNGDARIFYATVAGILAGSITGDHVSPISDTTVLTSLACECKLISHVRTQLPYASIVAFWSIIVGTIPIGYGSKYPNGVAIALGFVTMASSAFFLGVPVLNSTGNYCPSTELWFKIKSLLKIKGENEELKQLREDTVAKYHQTISGSKEIFEEDV